MSATLVVAVAQMRSSASTNENLAWIHDAAARARLQGAAWLALPENATLLAPPEERLAQAESLGGPTVEALRRIASDANIALLVGSVPELGPDPQHTYATALWISAAGELVATYRKAHLFDVQVSADTTFRESDTIAAGDAEPVLVDAEGWSVGLSICYDLRFPEHFRALSAAGANVLAVPAAFTLRTGLAHWEPLLRARAIENQCYVIAPAQWGRHYGARESYGNAMVVSPWGEVVARHERGIGIAYATIARTAVDEARAQIPCLAHRRR